MSTTVETPSSSDLFLERQRPRLNWRSLVLCILIMLPIVLMQVENFSSGYSLNLFETGTVFSGGLRIAHGEVPYTDFFAFYGPLAYLAPAASYALFGPTVLATVVLDWAIVGAGVVSAYWLVRLLTGRVWYALLAPLLIVLADAHGPRIMPGLVALTLTYLAVVDRRRWAAYGSGAAAGVGLLWLQDGGVMVTAAIGCVCLGALARQSHRSWAGPFLLRFIGGATAIVLPILGWLLAKGALGAWAYYCFVYPNTIYTDRSATGYLSGLIAGWSGLPVPVLIYKWTFYALPYGIVIVLAVACAGVALWRVISRGDRGHFIALALGVYAVLQLRVVIASFDEAKLASVVAPVIVALLVTATAFRPAGDGHSLPRRLAGIIAVTSVLYIAAWAVQKQIHAVAHQQFGSGVTSAGGSLGDIPFRATNSPDLNPAQLRKLVDETRSRSTAEGGVVAYPTQPLLNFFAEQTNPTRFDYLDPTYVGAEEDRAMVASLTRRPADVVLLSSVTFPGSQFGGSKIAPATYAWIVANYQQVDSVGSVSVLVHRPHAAFKEGS